MNVLVIDDNAVVRDLLVVAIERAGHRVQAVGNGNDGLDLVERGNVDAVVTDVFMPECDGIEVLRALRARRPDLPVLVISGGSPMIDVDFLLVAKQFGAVEILRKPFEPKELTSALARLAGQPAAA